MPPCKNVPVTDKLALPDDSQLDWRDSEGRLVKPVVSNVLFKKNNSFHFNVEFTFRMGRMYGFTTMD